jgi:hypothetical protein
VEWQAIEFNGDTQSLTDKKTVFTASGATSPSSNQLNMDCLGKVTGSRPEGMCAIAWTHKVSAITDPKIHINFMDEEGQNKTGNQVGGIFNNDWNPMVILTGENNFAITYMSKIAGK